MAGTTATLLGAAALGAGGSIASSALAPDAPSAAELNKQNLITQITPTGTQQVGSIGANGEFIPVQGGAATRVQETPFQTSIRGQQEQLQQDLFQRLGLNAFNEPTIQPRTADAIRAILPSAQGTTEGLGNIRTAQSIEQGLSPFVRTEDFGNEISRLENATFESVANRLRPDFQESESRLVQSLADRGIPLESRAAQLELEGLREQQSDALTQAAFGATAAGRAEQERLARLGLATRGQQVGEGLGLAGLESTTRAQGFQENRAQLQDALQKQLTLSQLESQQRAQQLGERQAGIGELSGLLSLGTPFVGQALNTGAGNNAALLQANAQQQQNQLFSSLAGIGGLALGGFGGGLPSVGASGIPAGGFAQATGVPFYYG